MKKTGKDGQFNSTIQHIHVPNTFLRMCERCGLVPPVTPRLLKPIAGWYLGAVQRNHETGTVLLIVLCDQIIRSSVRYYCPITLAKERKYERVAPKRS